MELSEGVKPPESGKGPHLKPAQIKMLPLLLQRKNPQEIAEALGIARKTVYAQRHKIWMYFKTVNVDKIAEKAYEMGIIPRPETPSEEQKQS